MEKELKLKTHWPSQTSLISFGTGFALLKRIPEIVDEIDRKVVVITDTSVEELYRPQIEHLDLKIFSFPSGEASKTRETKIFLEDHLLSHNIGRDTLILSLGGGVVGDMAGFIASTYCRGVPYIQIPTSLLAMVDSSVGAKTAVNTPYGKNMIGSFYPPTEVLIDGDFLATLPQKQWKNGIVEIIKAGLINSPALFEAMRDHVDRWESNDLEFIMQRIFESVAIKKEIVEKDPEEEKGIRRILNLGHTFGHALEILEDFRIEHGEAIAVGTLVCCYISTRMGLLSEEAFTEIKEVFNAYHIPLKIAQEHHIEDLIPILARDKKALKSSPRIVLLQGIGDVASFEGEYCTEIDFPLLEEAINWMHKEFYNAHFSE